ncbi:MAG: hypothetical protein LCI00_21865 [Chloroflexi bacterium]|nr:hypothetical protein [Chloroflexota bacterium]MCC6894956.1 hypothetical protein [Anaerolineae bacterium]
MADFVTLSCPNCGGKLKVTSDLNRFACSHCGAEHVVKRGDGIVSLSPVMDAIARVQTGVDVIAEDIRFRREQEAKAKSKIASEMAISRLKSDVSQLQNQLDPLQDKKNKASVKKLQAGAKSSLIMLVVCIFLAISLGSGNIASTNKVSSTKSSTSTTTDTTTCAGASWLAAIMFGISAYSTRKKAKTAADIESKLTSEISEKHSEIKRHEEIINQQI